MINFKIKKLGMDLSIILAIKVIVRVLCMSMMFFFLISDKPKNSNDLQFYSYIIGTIYYFLFLIVLDRYLTYSNKNISNQDLLTGNTLFKLIKYFKWFLLGLTVTLLVLTVMIMPLTWPDTMVKRILYLLISVFPKLFSPNISFIIISLLVFYASAIVNINRKLKQEQDLTI